MPDPRLKTPNPKPRLRSKPRARIGISGWTYPPWRGTFFPAGLVQREELAYAARMVSSIEINGTFYSLQRASSYGAWHDEVPEDFCFAVKGGRFITHIRRLKEPELPLANFFASGLLRLGRKLGPILWQLPPSLPFEPARLDAFLAILPRDTAAAARLAAKHNDKVKDPWFKAGENRPIRHALEVRHPSFRTRAFVDLLRRHQVALVVADTAGKWPFMEDVTADFVYVRLHGDEELYVSGYTPEALDEWARKVHVWSQGRNPSGTQLVAPVTPPRRAGRDVFVYFDNDVKVRAPFDAMTLAHLLQLGPKPAAPPPIESIAEKPRTSAEWPAFRRRAVRRVHRGSAETRKKEQSARIAP